MELKRDGTKEAGMPGRVRWNNFPTTVYAFETKSRSERGGTELADVNWHPQKS
jgi:hypothetical protein